jgi:3-oxoacyl-[acyl-carrier protein] reductase
VVNGLLEGRVAIVAGGSVGVGREVVSRLADAGAAVASIGPIDRVAYPAAHSATTVEMEVNLDDQEAVLAAFARIQTEIGPADVSVFAYVNPEALVQRPVIELSEDEWDRLAEAPVRSVLWWLQGSHRHMEGRGGRMIAICPSVAIEGASQLAPAAAAAEGQRGLVKSAARRWGAAGVTCNMIAPPVWALAPGLEGTDAARNTPSLPPAENPLKEIADAVVLLSGPYAARLTGITVNADSGALMSP